MSDRTRVAIKTFGCKLNQYESEQIREDFETLGFEVVDFDQPAEVYLINSCTVTHRTDRDTRRLARGARRRRPDCIIIVTGCYAQMQPQIIEALEVVDLVAPIERKRELARQAADRLARRGLISTPPDPARSPDRLISHFPSNTRAFVKVQDGCDAACAYCTITLARGPSRSVCPETALRQARMLTHAGHPEVVLVGIHLGMYGRDLTPPLTLDDLVREMCRIDALQRLRLSSIEPMEISDELVEMVCAGGRSLDPSAGAPCEGKLCRHLHIPLQSGCDATLERMRRPYRATEYRHLIAKIRERDPMVGIGADVMVGFPGETDEEFEASYNFVEQLPVNYLHVFTYSERPGTPAAEMPDQVNPEIRKRRMTRMRALSREKAEAFAEAAVGETFEVVVETPRDEAGRLSGVADNYLNVFFEGDDELTGQLVRVTLGEADGDRVSGVLVR